MRRYLRTLRLFGYCNGVVAKPPTEAPVEEVEAWEEVNNHAETVILAAVTRKIRQDLSKCKSAQEMWEKLKSEYSEKSAQGIMNLTNDLYDCRKGGKSVEEYVRELEGIIDQLAAAGKELSDEDIYIALLRGLPESWSTIKTTIMG